LRAFCVALHLEHLALALTCLACLQADGGRRGRPRRSLRRLPAHLRRPPAARPGRLHQEGQALQVLPVLSGRQRRLPGRLSPEGCRVRLITLTGFPAGFAVGRLTDPPVQLFAASKPRNSRARSLSRPKTSASTPHCPSRLPSSRRHRRQTSSSRRRHRPLPSSSNRRLQHRACGSDWSAHRPRSRSTIPTSPFPAPRSISRRLARVCLMQRCPARRTHRCRCQSAWATPARAQGIAVRPDRLRSTTSSTAMARSSERASFVAIRTSTGGPVPSRSF
jgi:hypothetical protein